MPAFLAKPAIKYLGLPLLALLLVSALGGGIFYLGYDYAVKSERAQLADEYEEDLRKIRLRWVEDRAKVNELQERLSQDVRKVRYITKEVPRYVTPDKDEYCGPPVGIVGLLNNARRPDLPFAPGLPDAEGRAPSGISYTEQTQDTLDITERYNALMLKYNTLIQWIEDNYGPAEQSGLRGSLERHSEVPQG